MYFHTFKADVGCKICQNLHLDLSLTKKSEIEIFNPILDSSILYEIRNNLICPNCDEIGNKEVFAIDYQNYIYDIKGLDLKSKEYLQIHIKKFNNEIDKFSIGSNTREYTIVDTINCLRYALHFIKMKESEGTSFFSDGSMKNGGFLCRVTFSSKDISEPGEYISLGEIKGGYCNSFGFDASELKDLLIETENRLNAQRQSEYD